MKAALLVGVVLAVAGATATATAVGNDYACAWPLVTNGDSAAWQIELAPEVYAAIARSDLGDVEVVDADGNAVAAAVLRPPTTTPYDTARILPLFALPPSTTTTGPETISLRVRRDGDGTLRGIDARVAASKVDTPIDADRARTVLADASATKAPLATLIVDWTASAAPVTARFAIDASDDLQRWRTVVAGATVMRLVQDGHVLERHDIALDDVRAAYLRLRRLDDGPPLHDLRVSVRARPPSAPAGGALAWVAATADGAEAAPTGRGDPGVAYRYRLPAPLAIEGLRVRLVDDNTVAALTVTSASPSRPSDRTRRGATVAFRLRQGDTILENDDASLATVDRVRDLRLETASTLAHPPVVTIAYRPDRLVFLAQGRGPYRLVAGSARRTRAPAPLDAALESLRASLGADWQPPPAALGPRATLAGDRAFVATARPRDWRTRGLWIVLVAAAVLIGGLAIRLLRTPEPARGASVHA